MWEGEDGSEITARVASLWDRNDVPVPCQGRPRAPQDAPLWPSGPFAVHRNSALAPSRTTLSRSQRMALVSYRIAHGTPTAVLRLRGRRRRRAPGLCPADLCPIPSTTDVVKGHVARARGYRDALAH